MAAVKTGVRTVMKSRAFAAASVVRGSALTITCSAMTTSYVGSSRSMIIGAAHISLSILRCPVPSHTANFYGGSATCPTAWLLSALIRAQSYPSLVEPDCGSAQTRGADHVADAASEELQEQSSVSRSGSSCWSTRCSRTSRPTSHIRPPQLDAPVPRTTGRDRGCSPKSRPAPTTSR